MVICRVLHRALHFAHAFLIQATQTALASGQSKIGERLARWKLLLAAANVLDLLKMFESLGQHRS
jgi:hypothetical protein